MSDRNLMGWIEVSNQKRIELIKRQNEAMVEYWVEILTKAKNAYYAGEPIMDDATYDHFENNIRLNDPNHPFLEMVGTVNQEENEEEDIL